MGRWAILGGLGQWLMGLSFVTGISQFVSAGGWGNYEGFVFADVVDCSVFFVVVSCVLLFFVCMLCLLCFVCMLLFFSAFFMVCVYVLF